MTWQRVITEYGSGNDLHGGDYTKAALRAVHGLPAMMLTDNGPSFNARRRGWTTELDRNLTALGIRVVSARPHHPQTCGKRERLNGTLSQLVELLAPVAAITEPRRVS